MMERGTGRQDARQPYLDDGRPIHPGRGPPIANVRRRGPTKPIEDAMMDLSRALDEATQFCNHFQNDFQQLTYSLPWLRDETINQMWFDKVHPSEKHRQNSRHQQSQHNEHSDGTRNDRRAPSFRGIGRRLFEHLGDVSAAAEAFRPQRKHESFSKEDVAKIRSHILRAHSSIVRSFQSAEVSYGGMRGVIVELEMLQVFMKNYAMVEDGRGGRHGGGRDGRQGSNDQGSNSFNDFDNGEEEEWDGGQQGDTGMF